MTINWSLHEIFDFLVKFEETHILMESFSVITLTYIDSNDIHSLSPIYMPTTLFGGNTSMNNSPENFAINIQAPIS